jgi:hypothetical protein
VMAQIRMICVQLNSTVGTAPGRAESAIWLYDRTASVTFCG